MQCSAAAGFPRSDDEKTERYPAAKQPPRQRQAQAPIAQERFEQRGQESEYRRKWCNTQQLSRHESLLDARSRAFEPQRPESNDHIGEGDRSSSRTDDRTKQTHASRASEGADCRN